MKIVFDSNVLISAFISSSACREIYEYAAEEHTVILSSIIVKEVERTLRVKFVYPTQKSSAIIELITSYAQYTEKVPSLSKKVSRDPNDDHILALAEHIQADVICTGDKDLLILKKYKKIPIIQPKDFWRWEDNQ